jgi:hypothetical protein
MEYLFLIYSEERREPRPGTKQFSDYLEARLAFEDGLKAKGILRRSAVLQPVATATTVRVRRGEPQTTDGPFPETEEQLGGFYVLSCRDLDEALDYAARIPEATHGAIEVRPIRRFDESASVRESCLD